MAKTLYQLGHGETLKSVARDKLGDESRWIELAYINSISAPYFVAPGTILQVPTDDKPLDIIVTGGKPPADVSPAPGSAVKPDHLAALAIGGLILWAIWSGR